MSDVAKLTLQAEITRLEERRTYAEAETKRLKARLNREHEAVMTISIEIHLLEQAILRLGSFV